MSLFFCTTTFAASANYERFYANAESYGFGIKNNYIPRHLFGLGEDINGFIQNDSGVAIRKTIIENKVKDKVENVTTIIDIMLENRYDSGLRCYMFKVITEPKQPGRNWGFMGIGSYGDDFIQDYVKVSIDLEYNHVSGEGYDNLIELRDYAPKNQPATTTGSIGVSGTDITASVDFAHKELTVESKTSTSNNYFECLYNFDGLNTSTYLRNEVSSFGLVLFRLEDNVHNFQINYEVKYKSINNYELNCQYANKKIEGYSLSL